jgi:signal peptidase I
MTDINRDDPNAPPTPVPEPESLESYRALAEIAPATDPAPSSAPEPLVPAEPVPVMAGAAPITAVAPDAAPLHQEIAASSTFTVGRVVDEVVAWLKTLASAAVYATLIVTFGFQVARVEGQSMAPTLEDQDRLIVNKLAYRLGDPQVGDIVMLYYPLNPDKSFVKRIIAEEHDTVRIVDGRVYRNEVLINDDYVPAQFRSHDDWGPEVVPEGYYFVMGDHRNNSSDSRHWKFVPKKYIIGKVQLRWWPLPEARLFWTPNSGRE